MNLAVRVGLTMFVVCLPFSILSTWLYFITPDEGEAEKEKKNSAWLNGMTVLGLELAALGWIWG